jgi:hypothetical protein
MKWVRCSRLGGQWGASSFCAGVRVTPPTQQQQKPPLAESDGLALARLHEDDRAKGKRAKRAEFTRLLLCPRIHYVGAYQSDACEREPGAASVGNAGTDRCYIVVTRDAGDSSRLGHCPSHRRQDAFCRNMRCICSTTCRRRSTPRPCSSLDRRASASVAQSPKTKRVEPKTPPL